MTGLGGGSGFERKASPDAEQRGAAGAGETGRGFGVGAARNGRRLDGVGVAENA